MFCRLFLWVRGLGFRNLGCKARCSIQVLGILVVWVSSNTKTASIKCLLSFLPALEVFVGDSLRIEPGVRPMFGTFYVFSITAHKAKDKRKSG